ncbi:type II toxin-antitoxin system Phd/YefM family antitoxin [Candidatus Poriferisodalis sp.]|uniref:type II toxin-antitoxin system Phd/YefM family antitoxin n=1 Tax=Candidatus Poriferisodalis sp. TaxID=3101277 RepID=UPI003B01902B
MAEVGIRELKQNASEVVARVEAGEEITVTNRGRPVARLVPHVRNPRRSRLEELIARGEATPATRDIAEFLPPPPAPPGRSLSEVLLEMRAEERY